MIVKEKDGYYVLSEKTKRNLGLPCKTETLIQSQKLYIPIKSFPKRFYPFTPVLLQ